MKNGDKRHIFIGGLHRSGTSLLHRALQAHSAISGFNNTGAPENEGQHLQTVFPAATVYGGPGKFCFTDEAHLDETSPLVTSGNREKLWCEWGKHWNPEKTIFIEKSPPNLIRTRFLQAMFPNSLFILIVRHPLAAGYATQKWSKTDIRELVRHWIVAHQRMLEDLPFIKQWRVIRYEDFVEDPKAVLTDIYQWIGVKPSPCRELVEPKINRKYFAQWETESSKNSAGAKDGELLHALPNQFGYQFKVPYTQKNPARSQSRTSGQTFSKKILGACCLTSRTAQA